MLRAGRGNIRREMTLLGQYYHLLSILDELGGNVPHSFHVICEGGCGRTGVAAGREPRAERIEAGAFERGNEGRPGFGKEVATVDDEDGGFARHMAVRDRGVGLHDAMDAGIWF